MNRSCNSSIRSMLSVLMSIVLAAVLALPASVLAAGFTAPASVFADTEPDVIPAADQFGQVELYSTASAGQVLTDSFSYSDAWFDVDPAKENMGLALLSMQLVSAASDCETSGLGSDFLGKLGFDGIGSHLNHDLGDDDCNFIYGTKTLDDGSMLVAVAIQSYAFDRNGKIKGWPQNFHVNGENVEGEHYMLSQASEAVLPEIVDAGGTGNVKYWITGQSRGGAIAGLIASKLPDKLGSRNKGIYAYTFESPSVVQPKNDTERQQFVDDYSYIHNYICSDDLVPIIPPRGMMRYGVEHELDTEETNSKLSDELKKLGSSQEIPAGYNKEDAKKKADEVLAALLSRIPSREEYSMDHEDKITLADGTEKAIRYNYQNLLGTLLASVFGGALDDADLAGAAEYLTDLFDILNKFERGYLIECGKLASDEDPNLLYWETASVLNTFLKDNAGVDFGLSDEELYAVLKLAAPVVIDENRASDRGLDVEPSSENALIYVEPAIGLPSMVFSHHFDSLLARLHALSPEREIGELDFDVEAPKVSDTMVKMPKMIKTSVAGSASGSWLTASAKWLSDDKTISNKKVYYLSVEFKAAGHVFDENKKIMINGEEPVEKTVSFKDGMSVASCVWRYTFGEPKKVKVSFDMSEHGEQIDDMEVDNGEILKYIEQPADPVAPGYRFAGWFDAVNSPWDENVANGNIFFYARWIKQVNEVNITFTVPKVGEEWKAPVVPAGAPYGLSEIGMIDSDYNDVTTIKNRNKHELSFEIRVLAGNYEFPAEGEEYDLMYSGKVYLNGKEVDAGYDNGRLTVYYDFIPSVKEPLLSASKLTMKAGQEAKLSVSYGVVKSWSSSDPKVASVKSGRLTALKKGSTTITAALTNGKKLKCTLVVKTSPSLSKSSISVKKGKTCKVKIRGKASSVSNSYKNTSKAKVISKKTATTLKIKGVKKGTTTLKIKVNGKWLKLIVKVK